MLGGGEGQGFLWPVAQPARSRSDGLYGSQSNEKPASGCVVLLAGYFYVSDRLAGSSEVLHPGSGELSIDERNRGFA